MKTAGIILILFISHYGFSQWTDNFDDDDFTLNPSWTGDTTDYIVETNRLRLSASADGGSAYLAVPSLAINEASWQFSVILDFDPTSRNYSKVYLAAGSENLNGAINGYYVKLGGTDKRVSLFRQDGLAKTEIILGTDGRLSLHPVNVQVLVTRSAAGEWQLSSKLDTETIWFDEGTIIDSTYPSSEFFGVSCVYTSSRAEKFYFDDITVTGTPFVDDIAPKVDTLFTQDIDHIVIRFDEAIEAFTGSLLSNYLLNNIYVPSEITPADSSVVLTFDNSLSVINNLTIGGIKDLHQNVLKDTILQIIYVDPTPAILGDIVINEIMADPLPREDLPDAEYFELYNTTNRAIDMTKWSYSDKVSTTKFDKVIILPDSFLILTSKTNVGLLAPYGKVKGLSVWPSLNNSADSISLLNGQGDIIDIVVYEDSWYQETGKNGGGWSLERINPKHPCSGNLNWQASMAVEGGTPGQQNSVLASDDQNAPVIINYEIGLEHMLITFDEPINTASVSISSTPTNDVLEAKSNYNKLTIQFKQPFISEQYYEVRLEHIADCFNNVVEQINISFTPDFAAPEIDTVFANYPNTLELYFNEVVQEPVIENFSIESHGSPKDIEQDRSNQKHLTLTYNEGLQLNEFYTLSVDGILDSFDNMTKQSLYTFKYHPLPYPKFSEVLITEIMADPSPAVNLPEEEYLELANKTTKRLLLKDLILTDAKNKTIIPTGIIEANERVILTKNTAVAVFSGYGKVIGIPNWPSLGNASDQIAILDTGEQIIHHVAYTDSWYDTDEKAAGGWSLELLDESNFCSGEKVWRASINNMGGTPGAVNSTVSILSDLQVPHVNDAFAISADSIIIRFDESLNNHLPTITIANHAIIDIYFSSLSRNEIILYVEPLQPRIKYEIIIGHIIDCVGNINMEEKVTVFLPEKANQGDVIISELLFNPSTDGVDFIEIYNNSPKYISLFNWQISDGTSNKIINAMELLSPYTYRVYCEVPQTIISEYPKAIPEHIYYQEIPAMANDDGNIVLFDKLNNVQDTVHYNADWHFSYLANDEGVSLERLNFGQAGYLSASWASAAATENYATPGYKNSQVALPASGNVLSIDPKVIVPNANGMDDFANIVLEQQNSALATITIYNLEGQAIKQIANNTLVGSSASFIWDGTDNAGAIVPLGHYIIVAETTSNSGTTETFRDKVVVATGF